MNETQAKKYFEDFWKQHPYKIIEFRDEKWKYIISGKKDNPPVILLPGGFVDAGMWAYQIQDLEKDFKLLVPTFPSAPRSFRLYCDIIDFLMQKERIEAATICGLSYGGFLCQYFAKYFPNRVSKLILSHTFKPDKKFAKHIKLKSSIIRIIPNFIYNKKFQKRIKELDSTGWTAYRKYYFQNIFNSYSKKEFAKVYVALSKSILEDPLEKDLWEGPTVILSSKDDSDVIKYQKDLINTYPQAELYEFEKGTHHTALTYPVEYTEVLRKYIHTINK